MRTMKVTGLLALLAIGTTVPAVAQSATIGADAYLYSAYVWRGLTFSSKLPVIQPDVWVSVSGFTAGAWANIDPVKCDSAGNSFCEAGTTRSGIAEIDYWVEYGRTFGNISAKAGWVAYTFNKKNGSANGFGGFSNVFNTSEVYASASIGGLPFTPSLGVWYDIDNVKGLYLQPQVSYGVKAGPTTTVTLTALAGISAGQEVNTSPGSTEGANFAKSGLTHVDFSAATSFTAGPLSIAPSFHVQVSHDQFTKLVSINKPNQGAKFWGGVTLSWSHSLGASTASK